MTRKYLVFLTFVVSLFMAANASAQYAHISKIVGSVHDLATGGYQVSATYASSGGGGAFTEICFFCHIPHPTATNTANSVPLWNHTLSGTATYGVYSSPTFNTLTTNIKDLGGATASTAVISNLCLSCHDGTVGFNSWINTPPGYPKTLPALNNTHGGCAVNTPCTMYSGMTIGNVTLGVGMSADHPINFTYDSTLVAQVTNLVQPVAIGGSTYSTGVKAGSTVLPLFTYRGGMANTMQCSTCHEVHDPTNFPFLRMANNGSALCLACHGA